MFDIGDLIIYSAHGICHIDDICEKTVLGVKKKYYILHPVEDPKLSISTPVDNDKVTMLQLLTKKQAQEILDSFHFPGTEWIERDNERIQVYSDIVKRGDRKEISDIANTLMRRKHQVESSGKKFHVRDSKLLTNIQDILFAELAYSLDTTNADIAEKVNGYIVEGLL